MSRFVIRGQFPFKAGMAEKSKAAALDLQEQVVREQEGIVVYEFAVDDANRILTITEAYADERALLDHIDASDFMPLFDTLDFAAGTIQLQGNPSATLRQRLEAFGPVEQCHLACADSAGR